MRRSDSWKSPTSGPVSGSSSLTTQDAKSKAHLTDELRDLRSGFELWLYVTHEWIRSLFRRSRASLDVTNRIPLERQ